MRTWVPLILALAACAPPQTVCTFGASDFDRFLSLNSETTITLGVAFHCNGTPKPPDSVEVVVTDPNNRPVQSERSAPTFARQDLADGGVAGSALVRVSFTATTPGVWQIATRFEPSFGFSQHAVRTIDAHADAGNRVLPWPSEDCDAVDVTDSDNSVCFQLRPPRPRLIFGSPKLELEADGPRSFAVLGNAVWVVRGGKLERYSDNGSGVKLTNSIGLDLTDVTLAPYGNAVWAAGYGSHPLTRADPGSDGGIALHVVDGPALDPHWLVGTEHAVLGLAAISALFVDVDGGTAAFETFPKPVASDFETLWFSDGSNFAGLNLSPNGVVGRTIAIPSSGTDADALFLRGHGFTPLIRAGPSSQIVVPRVGQTSIDLGYYEPGLDYSIVNATARRLFARSSDGLTMKVIDR